MRTMRLGPAFLISGVLFLHAISNARGDYLTPLYDAVRGKAEGGGFLIRASRFDTTASSWQVKYMVLVQTDTGLHTVDVEIPKTLTKSADRMLGQESYFKAIILRAKPRLLEIAAICELTSRRCFFGDGHEETLPTDKALQPARK